MRVLLVQLSDIHFRNSENSIVSKRDLIVSAVRNIEPNARLCLLLYTGDIVNTGADEEYSAASRFIDDLNADLRTELPPGCELHSVMIPGNHDCNLREDNLARDMLRKQVLATPERAVDNSVIEICTGVQRSFFELRDLSTTQNTLQVKNNLYWVYRFRIDDEAIEVRCLNSSWLSELHETEGSLHFPVEIIDERSHEPVLAISLLHHPFAWYNTVNRRQLQKRLEEVSDIVFTGHEHAESRRTQAVSTGETNQFIEGAALQVAGDTAESSFNVIAIDTESKQQRFLRFEWQGELYVPTGRSDWETFQTNRLRTRGEFELLQEFAQFLEDPGAGFEKANFGRPRLSQLFVHPDLRRLTLRKDNSLQPLGADKLFDSTFETANVLITAGEQAGKTCLAKWLFSRFREAGLVPLFVDGAEFVPQRSERLHEQLYRIFEKQYDADGAERYRQLQRSRRILIVDNFSRVKVAPGRSAEFLADLDQFAGRVFLLTNDLAHALGEIVRAGDLIEQRATYSHYRVMPFGHAKRMELTTRWLSLDEGLGEEQFARRLAEADEKISTVLGRNFVPSYPIFLLAMLQGLDSGDQADISGSAYGYFYEILIRTTLAKDSRQDEFNIRIGFLTWLGSWMFEQGRTAASEEELRVLHSQYEQRFDVRRSFRDVVDDLENRLVLVRFGDKYEFKYKYYQYYFVARYLSQMITKHRAEAERRLRDLAADVADEEKANILLFLAHLTDDDMVVSLLIESAKSHFADQQIARLEEDVEFLSEFVPVALDFEFEDRSYKENRLAIAEKRDRIEWNTAEHEVAQNEERAATQSEFDEVQKVLNRYIAALRTLQLLGQVLKNFPGTIEASAKEAMAIECFSLGFRALDGVVQLIRDGREDMVAHAARTIREEGADLEEEKIKARANSVVFSLALMSAFGIVKRISAAVGSPELTLTYGKVEAALPFVSTRLTNMSIRLDQLDGFPEDALISLARGLDGSVLPKSVLRWLVLTHVNLFPVGFQERQRVFAATGIRYSESIGANPKRRLIGGGASTEKRDS